MNDEIKEIELWKEKTKGIFHITEYTRFWYYITNLQQENERLKMRNDMLRKDIDSFIVDNKIDYKSRCEKAIEYIKSGKTFDNEVIRKVVDKMQNDLLNILQNGGEKNEKR